MDTDQRKRSAATQGCVSCPYVAMYGRTWIAAIAVIMAGALQAQTAGRHALLIGINDYSASRLPPLPVAGIPDRDVPNLDGTVNDVEIIHDLLVALYGFKPADILILTDQHATRNAIFRALEQQLVATTHKGDIVFFYFSGHGSQVRNSLSTEADRLDESILPADSRRGARDIRDKELLAIFNEILDRGARLTIVLDTCHSGSGARGLYGGLHYRGVRPDLRDVADPFDAPSPESRGALILSATQDFDLAFEMLDENGTIRGAFTWALARAMRDADAGEPASETFLRAQARLHAERPAQQPVLAGNAEARAAPLLGVRTDRRDHRAVIAVEKASGSNIYLLQGGWATGVTIGSELRLANHNDVRLEVTSLLGVAHSVAQVTRGAARLQPGTLLEIVTWAAPPSPPLRIWIPRAPHDMAALARTLREEASRRAIRWVDDPTEISPTHLLRWRGGTWELVAHGRHCKAGAASLANVPSGASLFVQFPAPAQVIEAFGGINGVELTSSPDTADYVLAGRLAQDHFEYACIRPFVTVSDRARSVLPLRTEWSGTARAFALRDCVVRLRVVQAWQDLRSPAASASHYRLALRRAIDGTLVDDGRLLGDTRYNLFLREREQSAAERIFAHYVYVFVIASDGSSVLLFPPPETGTVENLLPITATPGQPLHDAPPEIPLAGTRPFTVTKPYGMDTYFLLSTDEPLPSLAGLEWSGVRGPRAAAKKNPLEELLAQTLASTRAPNEPMRTPPNWTIDKVTFESVPPRRVAR
jgi:Caspase domain